MKKITNARPTLYDRIKGHCLRLIRFLNGIPHYLLACCILLVLALIVQKSLPYRSGDGNATDAIASVQAITLTLEDDEIIAIQTDQTIDVPYITLNADSLLQEHKGDIHCNGWATLKVPAGFPPVQLRLPDGTLVHLNAGSTLRYPACFAVDKRLVTLAGEAYFEVTPDAQRIFSVKTRELTIRVTGTSFCVSSYRDNNRPQVSLVEGAVVVSSGNKEKRLRPGLAVVLDKQQKALSTTTFDPRLVLSWRKGMYYFDGEPLESICKVITRMYGNTVIIDGKDLARRKFSGSINRKQPLGAFLNYIKDIAGVDHYYDKKGMLHLK
jgi:hypothetical protein